MKNLSLLVFLILFSHQAHASVIHDLSESKQGWSFNFAASARKEDKITHNVFIPKCQKDRGIEGCAEDQREARTMANKQVSELEKHKKSIKKHLEQPNN